MPLYLLPSYDEMEDMIEHDKNEDATEMEEDTEALITENWCFGIKETLGRDKISMEQANGK